MSKNTQQLPEPTVDDLQVKLCYICLEEEHYHSPPEDPPVWTHPCKCTLIAHESCLLHWIHTQKRDFGRSPNRIKCPQCREFFEYVDYNPTALRVLRFLQRSLSRFDRIVTWFYAGATVVLFGAGVYVTCTTYGAFAVREFLGSDMFDALLTANPTLWPRHAWVNLPLIPFSLITTCAPFLWTNHSLVPLLLWLTPSFVPLLSPWLTSPSVVPDAARGNDTQQLVHPASLRMWPPPPALVCVLFPYIRVLHKHLRTRVTRALVHGQVPIRRQLRQVERQEQLRQRDLQELLRRLRQRQGELLQRLRRWQQTFLKRLLQGRQEPLRRLRQWQEAEQDRQWQLLQREQQQRWRYRQELLQRLRRLQEQQEQVQPGLRENQGRPQRRRRQQEQRQQQEQQEHEQRRGQEQREEQQQEQQQEQEQRQDQEQPEEQQQERQQRLEQANRNVLGAVAAGFAIRVMVSSLGRLVCGALAMPTIARVMGAILLQLSHSVPWVRVIIASRPLPPSPPLLLPPLLLPSAPAPAPSAVAADDLLRFWNCTQECAQAALGVRVSDRDNANNADVPIQVVAGGDDVASGEFSTMVLSRFLATSHEWAMSDPVWWRNALGLCVFLVVKDALEILYLRLANAQFERRIKSKPFSGVDLTKLDLIERHT